MNSYSNFFTKLLPAKNIFCIALILVSILPILSILITYKISASFGVIVSTLVVIGSTHVLATIYLLSDDQTRQFFLSHPIRLIVIPLGLIISGPFLFYEPNTNLFTICIFVYVLYGAYHFGSQSIGVATFVSLSNRQSGLNKFEKCLIRACILCGMAGVLRITYPDFTIGKDLIAISPNIFRVLEIIYSAGRFAAMFLSLAVLIVSIKNLYNGKILFAIGFFLSATFLFPMYLTLDFMLGYGSFITAHGLQYLIFLIAHSMGNGNQVLAKSFKFLGMAAVFIAPLFLMLTIILAKEIWSTAPQFKYNHYIILGQSLILSTTLAHFWVDQFIWRMKNPDRAAWLKNRYAFIF